MLNASLITAIAKCVEKPMNPFHGHENSDFGFHGAKLSQKISMKFFTSYFHEP